MIHYLRQLLQSQFLSDIQKQIVYEKANGLTYREIQLSHSISCPNVIQKCLRDTSLGRHWVPGAKGGNKHYLSDIDQQLFKQKIFDECDSFRCIPTNVTSVFAYQFACNRVNEAKEFLMLIGCPNFAIKLSIPDPPCKSWLKPFCDALGIRIVKSQEFEMIRRRPCDVNRIFSFFETNYSHLQKDPRLVFNINETMLSSKRKYKVLARRIGLPLQTYLI